METYKGVVLILMGCSKAKFKFFNIDENILISTSKEDYKNDKKNSIDVIANNTENTWPQDRSKTELIKNTTQGKIVEDMFCELIDYHNKASKDGKKLTYVSYDEIRTDKFKKHAPIDGLLYVEGNSNINNAIAMINKDVEKNTYGKLSYDTKNNLSDFKIRTVEIKSSNIPQKDYNNINKDNFSKVSEQKKLISNLRKRDFFVYPKYTRTKGETIHCFKDYCNYVKQNFQEYHNLDDKQVEDKICDIEKKDKCDIYTRRQDTKPAYPRRFMNSITCCLFASRSSISPFNLRLKIERFPSASSSLRSTIWTPARRLFSFALFVRVKSLYSPCSAR